MAKSNPYSAMQPYHAGTKTETCSNCGCIFDVDVTMQDGHNEME